MKLIYFGYVFMLQKAKNWFESFFTCLFASKMWKICEDGCWELLEGKVKPPYLSIEKDGTWKFLEGSFPNETSDFPVVEIK